MPTDKPGKSPPKNAPPKSAQQKDKEKRKKEDDYLDEALEETFPASDPVAVGRSDHAGAPPSHQSSAEPGRQRKHS